MHKTVTEVQIVREGYHPFRVSENTWKLACQLARMAKKIDNKTYGPEVLKTDLVWVLKAVAPDCGLLHLKLCYDEAVDYVALEDI